MGELPRWVEVVLGVVFLFAIVVVPVFVCARDHIRGRQDPGYEEEDWQQTRPR